VRSSQEEGAAETEELRQRECSPDREALLAGALPKAGRAPKFKAGRVPKLKADRAPRLKAGRAPKLKVDRVPGLKAALPKADRQVTKPGPRALRLKTAGRPDRIPRPTGPLRAEEDGTPRRSGLLP
jgi:hypothetical protein